MHRIGKASMKAYVKGTVVATVVFLSAGAAQAQNGADGTLNWGSSYHANPYYYYSNPARSYYYYDNPGPWEGWKRNF